MIPLPNSSVNPSITDFRKENRDDEDDFVAKMKAAEEALEAKQKESMAGRKLLSTKDYPAFVINVFVMAILRKYAQIKGFKQHQHRG
ncbi:hypothetical protein GOBAR_DD17025 [Gossypium barbadense]|nr:hypothetical protein GOBAR_DD17025 [Gossypium barbadense]